MGAIFGSFLNVIIYRLPLSISIVLPRSYCPNCKKSIPFYENIPILSFILLKGNCSKCKKAISIQYPIVELISGLLFLFSFNNYMIIESIFFIIISSLLICIAIIDYKNFVIPISLSIISFFIIIIHALFFSEIIFHLFGMLIGFSYLAFIYLLTYLIIKKQPMGYGDFILMIVLGLWLGPLKILITIFSSSILGLLYWMLISILKGYKKDRKLPFGTFLSLTAILLYVIKINY